MTTISPASIDELERAIRTCIESIQDRLVPPPSPAHRPLLRMLALLWSAHDELEVLLATSNASPD